jgi:hypothetical protein
VGRDEEFTEYATARAVRLRETAYLMCGDWHLAQDLTQATLARVYVAITGGTDIVEIDRPNGLAVLLREYWSAGGARLSLAQLYAIVSDPRWGATMERSYVTRADQQLDIPGNNASGGTVVSAGASN